MLSNWVSCDSAWPNVEAGFRVLIVSVVTVYFAPEKSWYYAVTAIFVCLWKSLVVLLLRVREQSSSFSAIEIGTEKFIKKPLSLLLNFVKIKRPTLCILF